VKESYLPNGFQVRLYTNYRVKKEVNVKYSTTSGDIMAGNRPLSGGIRRQGCPPDRAIMAAMRSAALLLSICAGTLWCQQFMPPTGRGCPAAVLGGPCGRRLMSARSDDGVTFTRTNRIVTDQGDVPDLVVDGNGWIYLYYVGATVGQEINKLAVAISRDAGETWTFQRAALEGFEGWSEPVDPDVPDPAGWHLSRFPYDGRGRHSPAHLVRGRNRRHPLHAPRPGVRSTGRSTRPEHPADRRYLAHFRRRPDVAAWRQLARHFRRRRYLHLRRRGAVRQRRAPARGLQRIAVDGGYRFYAFTHDAPPVINSFFTTDGVTWIPDPGTRLEMDASTGLESEGVKDAAVVRLPDGSFFMIYVTGIQESAAPVANDLDFRPDAGSRVMNASLPKPGVDAFRRRAS